MKRLCPLLLPILLLAACESDPDFWNAETCNQRIEMDVVDFEKYQTRFKEVKEQMETDARRGDTANAEANKKNAESWIESTKSLLGFIDSNIMPVCEGKIRQDLLQKIQQARDFAAGTGVENVEAEGMPDVRVSGITSTFIPFEMDQWGRCVGPFLDLAFTVINQGADFPRPVDLQTYAERAERAPEELQFFTLIGELDFGGDMKKRIDIEVHGGSGGWLKAGSSLTLHEKIFVENNQTHVKLKGHVVGMAFLKTGEGESPPYETEVDIPIWDIHTVSHMAIQSKDDDGKSYIGTKASVTNKGGSPTPGPVQANFVLNDGETGRYITGWTGTTDSPIGSADIYAKTPYDGKLPTTMTVDSGIIPLCPDGTVGNLSDGDAKSNSRKLKQQQ